MIQFDSDRLHKPVATISLIQQGPFVTVGFISREGVLNQELEVVLVNLVGESKNHLVLQTTAGPIEQRCCNSDRNNGLATTTLIKILD